MSDDLKILGVDGIRRSYDEHYDTMMDVEQDPTGAWQAIQKQADRIEQLAATNEELEAKLAKAVEGLQDVAKEFSKPDAGLTDFGERQHYLFLTCKLRDKARTTIAELKGGNDD